MALVLVLLFATLCGVHTASISKSDALDVTLDTLDSKLDGLDAQTSDHIKHKVLEGVKRLLDLQLAALVKDGEHSGIEGTSKKGTKSKTKTRSRLLRRNEKNKESSSLEEATQNSELTSLLSDESIPDPADGTIRNAVDKLLKDNKDIILEDKDEIILDNNVDMLELENSTNNNTGDIMSQIEYDKIASQLIKASRGSVEKHVDSTTKHSKHNKKIKDEFNLNKDKNLDEYINRLMKPDNDTERNVNHNKKLVYETYKPRQKIGKSRHSYNKKSHSKMRYNGDQDSKKNINDNNDKFATKLIQTESNEHENRKSGYDVHEKKRDESRNTWQLSLGAVSQENQETNKINNAQSKKTHEKTKNNEETYVVIRDGEVKNKIGYEDSGHEEDNNGEEKESIIPENYGVERSHLINNQKKKKQLASDEYDTNTLTLQANKDIANENTRDDIHHRNDITDMKDVIIKYEVNLNNDDKSITFDENSNENTSDEKKREMGKAIQINMNKNRNNNERTKKDTNDLKYGALLCHNEKQHESGDSKLIRDLIQNNDIKKSIAFSLNFTSQ